MKPLTILKCLCAAGLLALALPLSLFAQTMTLRLSEAKGASGSTLEVPIDVAGASKVGALQFELVYNQAILAAESARAGALASDSLIEVRRDIPGRLFIALITTSGINGNGTVATASFRVTGMPGQSTSLTPDSGKAWEGITHHEVLITPVSGVLTVTGPAFPWLWIVIALAILLILLIIFIVAKKSRRKPTATEAPASAAPASAAPTGRGNFCRNCGNANPPGTRFCRNCGQPFD